MNVRVRVVGSKNVIFRLVKSVVGENELSHPHPPCISAAHPNSNTPFTIFSHTYLSCTHTHKLGCKNKLSSSQPFRKLARDVAFRLDSVGDLSVFHCLANSVKIAVCDINRSPIIFLDICAPESCRVKANAIPPESSCVGNSEMVSHAEDILFPHGIGDSRWPVGSGYAQRIGVDELTLVAPKGPRPRKRVSSKPCDEQHSAVHRLV